MPYPRELRTTLPAVPPVGTRIRLIHMPHDPDPVPPGTCGTVTGGSIVGGEWTQIWVKWDDPMRSISLAVPPDSFEVLS